MLILQLPLFHELLITLQNTSINLSCPDLVSVVYKPAKQTKKTKVTLAKEKTVIYLSGLGPGTSNENAKATAAKTRYRVTFLYH